MERKTNTSKLMLTVLFDTNFRKYILASKFLFLLRRGSGITQAFSVRMHYIALFLYVSCMLVPFPDHVDISIVALKSHDKLQVRILTGLPVF